MSMWINKTHVGDCRDLLRRMAADGVRVQTCVTSPPYWGLRDYGVAGAIGLEPSVEEWVRQIVEVFRAVRTVLADDGTVWLNLGDSYSGGKNLVGQPWLVAFALKSDGWRLRSDIIWHKPNPMPESVTDRPTKSHEYIFLLSKSDRYHYDSDAIKEKASPNTHARMAAGFNHAYKSQHAGSPTDERYQDGRKIPGLNPKAVGRRKGPGSKKDSNHRTQEKQNDSFSASVAGYVDTRNKRSVWTVPTEGFSGAHFATFPRDLIKPCILAGCPAGGIVLDPFMGSGTTAQVATDLGRQFIGCELNPKYVDLHELRRTTIGLAI